MRGAARIICAVFIAAFVAVIVSCNGCDAIGLNSWQWFSPDKPIHTPVRTPVMPIFDEYSPIDQVEELVPNSTFPTDENLTYSDTDYVMGPTDMLDIAIMDLYSPGVETVLREQISDSGFIRLPHLPDQILASGLTKEQLRDAIIENYTENGILTDPTVSVAIVARRQSTFSVLGAVSNQGPYMVARKDMRLLEALAYAGGVTNPNLPYIYVIRHTPPARAKQGPTSPWPANKGEGSQLPALPELPELPTLPKLPAKPTDVWQPQNKLPQLPPLPTKPDQSQSRQAPELPELPAIPTKPEAPATTKFDAAGSDIKENLKELEQLIPGILPSTAPDDAMQVPADDMLPEPSTLPSPSETDGVTTSTAPSDNKGAEEDTEWIFKDGAWILVPKVAAEPVNTPALEPTPQTQPTPQSEPVEKPTSPDDPFGWKNAQKIGDSRIIAIDYARLKKGDPAMNIVIHDNDVIQVPALEFGEFYMYGEVQRPGVYSLTGRKITVKMALAAAGNLSFLAYPKNSVLIRRVGKNEEQTIPLDINAIFQGKQPDYYLKADDIIAVGTNAMVPVLATIRNAFRLTYGFGFVYDRNFSEALDNIRGLNSTRFTRW